MVEGGGRRRSKVMGQGHGEEGREEREEGTGPWRAGKVRTKSLCWIQEMMPSCAWAHSGEHS